MAVFVYLSRWQLRANGRAARCRCGGDRVLVAGSTQEGHSGCDVWPHPPHALPPQRRECAALLAAPFGPAFHIAIPLEPKSLSQSAHSSARRKAKNKSKASKNSSSKETKAYIIITIIIIIIVVINITTTIIIKRHF